MKEEKFKQLISEVAEGLVPDEVSVLSSLQTRFEKNHLDSPNRSKLQPQRPKIRWGLAAPSIALLLGFIFVLTPAGSAWAKNVLGFFVNIDSDTTPVPTQAPVAWVFVTPGGPDLPDKPAPEALAFEMECGSARSPHCSTAELQSKVSFELKELSEIPESMFFIGATGSPEYTELRYQTPDQSSMLLLIQKAWSPAEKLEPIKVGSSAVIEPVEIDAATGEYVRGSFTYAAGDETMQWSEQHNQAIHWIDGNVYRVLINMGTLLDKSTFLAIAKNLSTDLVSIPAAPVTAPAGESGIEMLRSIYPLNIDELVEQAGFSPLLPAKLPNTLQFIGAAYDNNLGEAKVLYATSSGNESLVLSQQIIPATNQFTLSPFVVGEGTQVGTDPNLTPVGEFNLVGIHSEADGQYVEGTWAGTDCCGWQWSADPFLKRIRWQTDDRAFELLFMGAELSKDDLITIAKNIP